MLNILKRTAFSSRSFAAQRLSRCQQRSLFTFPRIGDPCRRNRKLFSTDGKESKVVKTGTQQGAPISFKGLAFMMLTGIGVVSFYQYQREKSHLKVKVGKSVGKVQLGGPFELLGLDGKPVKSSDFAGQYVLIYFGFTMCPDICPAELNKMNEALESYAKLPNAQHIQPIFISIDPARDTPERMKQYASENNFHKDTIWLTGSFEQIQEVARHFRVYFSAPEVEEGDDYLVDHSIFFYLMDHEFEFMEFFGKNTTAEEVSAKMSTVISEDVNERALTQSK